MKRDMPHPVQKPARGRALSASVLLLLCACATRGPSSIADQRGPYTQVLATTDKEELLANIVRLAYSDPPMFFQVDSVTASPSIEYGTDAEVRFGGASAPPPVALLKPRVLYKDDPTIVYRPLLGKEFASEMLLPFGLRTVFLMIDNGFEFSIIAELMFKSMNHVSNARDAAPEERRRFRELVHALSAMAKRGELRVGTGRDGLRELDGSLQIAVAPGALTRGEGALVAELLDLDPATDSLPLRFGLHAEPGSLVVNPRSLLSLLSYMSNYVEAPPGHEGLIWPSAARTSGGGLMRVRASRERPVDGDPAVFYRGHWFYIAEDDLGSRNALFLIRLLFNLQAQASTSKESLQLTLPVK